MTNDESAFREVDQSLAEDRQWEFMRRNGPIVLGAAGAIVLAVGGWQFWQAQKQAAAEAAAVEFRDVVATLQENPASGREELAEFAAEAPAGYAVLAEFRRAASLARGGERDAALSVYRKIYGEARALKRLKDLARLRAAYLSIEESREAVLRDLGDLPEDQSAFGAYAREVSALAALNAEDYETARTMFERAAVDLSAPEPIRLRAREFAALAAAGRAGVDLFGGAQADDLLDALNRESAGSSAEIDTGTPDIEGDGNSESFEEAQEQSGDVDTSVVEASADAAQATENEASAQTPGELSESVESAAPENENDE